MKKVTKILSLFLSLILIIQTMPVSSATASDLLSVFGTENVSEDSSGENTSTDEENEKVILYEIKEDRTQNTKSFMQSDGTRLIAQYESAVHFENEQGEFIEYDNSLSQTDAEDVFTEEAEIEEVLSEENETEEVFSEEAETEEASSEETETEEATSEETETEEATSEEIETEEVTSEVTEFEEVSSEVAETEETLFEVPETEIQTAETDSEENEKEYKTNKSDIDIRISKKTNGKKLVRISKDGFTLSWNYQGVKKVTGEIAEKTADNDMTTLENLTSKVTFSGVFGDTDFEYLITGDSLKENIILTSENAPHIFTAEYKCQGLIPELSEDKKTIYLKDSENQTVFVITAPYMIDANGEQSTDIYYELGEIKNNKFSVTLITDKQWLNAENRAYPVTVDPVILTQQSWSQESYQSAYISEYMPDSCFGRGGANYEGSLYVGYEFTSQSARRDKTRSLIRFSLPELKSGDRVIGATLVTYLVACYPATTVNVKRVTSDWAQSNVTWKTQPTVSSVISEYKTIPQTEETNADFFEWDITTLVNGWCLGQYENYGIMLTSPAENSNSLHRARFYSTGYTSASVARPFLTIAIRNMSGLEEYYSYSSFNAQKAGSAYVNDFTGNLVFMHNDISTSGLLMPVSVSGVYNTTSAGLFPATYPNLGRGKKLNIQQTLRPSSYYGLSGESLEMFPYAYEDGDGTVHYFYKETKDGSTKYIDEDGLNLELKLLDGSYEITDKNGNRLLFSSDGLLTSSINADGIESTYSYKKETLSDGSEKSFLYKITDGAGHIINLTYDTSYGYLTKMTGPDGKSITYSYTNQLNTGITYADSTTSLYSYNSVGRLVMAKSPDGYELDFTYAGDSSGGIETVTEKSGNTAGQYVKITRKQAYQTIIRSSGQDRVYGNYDDVRTVYQFDTYGRVASVKTGLGSGTIVSMGSYDFTMGATSSNTDIRKRNRIEASSATGKTVNNLLDNHSFENNSGWTASHWLNDAYADSSSSVYDSSQAYMGSKSLKITVNEASVTGGYTSYQHAIHKVTGGKTYTASVYIKTNGITKMSGASTGGAGLGIRIIKADGSAQRIYSDMLTGTSDNNSDNGWQRVEVTFTVPEGATNLRITPLVYCATGSAYFDCIQLEEGSAANKYNLLQNTGFENGTASWTAVNAKSTDIVNTSAYNTGASSYLLEGEPGKEKNIYQTVKVSGSEADTYIISGFAKANAVSFSETDTDRLFAFSVKVCYTDGTEKIKYPAYFNFAVNDWQNVSGAFTLSDEDESTNKTPASITVYCNYSNQANTCYFDDICLLKEPVPTYKYDSDGNLVSATENAQKTSALSYDVNDNLTGVTDEKNVNYTYTYGNDTNPHQLTSATENVTGIKNNYQYFDNGNIKALNVTASDNSGIIRTSVAYKPAADGIVKDAYLFRYVDEHGRNTYYDYDSQSGFLNSVKDANGNYTYYTYNENNGLVTSVKSGNSTVSYSYDSTYSRLNSISHNGFTYGFTYDSFGNMLKTTAGGNTLITNTYAAGNGLLTQSTYGNSDTVSYVYDSPGRVTGIKHNGTSSYTWTYSGSGIPNSFTDNVSGKKYQYTYDSLGRLIYQSGKSTSGSNRSSSAYKYDIADNLTQITNTAGTLGVSAWYHYDNVNRPTKSYFNTASEHNYVYDKLGRLESADVKLSGNTVNRDFTYYDSATRNTGSTAYTTTQLKTETIGDRGYTYTYDNVGNIIAITEKTTANGSYSPKASYIYDSLGQLIRENNKDLNKTVVYSYDNGGNIKTVKEYAYTTGTVGTATKTISYTYDSAWKDKLVSYDGQSITYDGIGNPLTYRDGMSFTWFARRMETADVNGTAITYKYDADGLRTEKKVGNTVHEYEYTGSTLFYENRGGIQLHYRYDVNGNLASITRIKADGTKFTLYAICNSRGDVEELRTLAGDLYARYVYDTWGNTLHIYNASGAEITDNNNLAKQNPLRYRGYYFDAETGFYYLLSRYYDPVTHRFLNADGYVSTGTGLSGYNMFAYCNNNPVMFADKTGTSIGAVLLFIGGGFILIGTVVGAIIGYKSDDKLINVNKNTNSTPTNTPINTANATNTVNANNKQNLSYDSYNVANKANAQSIEKQGNTQIEAKLSFGDKVLNAVIGAGVAMAISGAMVAMIGTVGVVAAGTMLCPASIMLTSKALFAMGAIAFDMSIFVIGPMLGLSTEPIEGINSNNGG